MTQSTKKSLSKKTIFLASLGIIIPIFLVSMAFVAVSSDAKNQEKYKQQHAENLAKIKAREQAEQLAKDNEVIASEVVQ